MSNVNVGSSELYKGALSAAPSNPATGWMYYDTDDGSLYVYAGGVWNPISGGTPPPSSYYLLENGVDRYQLEDGSGNYILE